MLQKSCSERLDDTTNDVDIFSNTGRTHYNIPEKCFSEHLDETTYDEGYHSELSRIAPPTRRNHTYDDLLKTHEEKIHLGASTILDECSDERHVIHLY